jgi:hypothetical protein
VRGLPRIVNSGGGRPKRRGLSGSGQLPRALPSEFTTARIRTVSEAWASGERTLSKGPAGKEPFRIRDTLRARPAWGTRLPVRPLFICAGGAKYEVRSTRREAGGRGRRSEVGGRRSEVRGRTLRAPQDRPFETPAAPSYGVRRREVRGTTYEVPSIPQDEPWRSEARSSRVTWLT